MYLDRKSETTPKGEVINGNVMHAEISGNAKRHDRQTTTSPSSDHYAPTVRLLQIPKTGNGACGFRLTRSKWDPYPWVSAVDVATPANVCGLKAGDCVLEVNGEDVLGLRITEIAELVKARPEHVTLLLWSSGCDAKCDPESICCGPMPRSLQRLSAIVQSILSIIECPICFNTIPPPAMQCQNGHLLCVNCRIRAEKCPVCRDRYTPRRALIAEKIYNAITSAFNLCCSEDKLRQKLFGSGLTTVERTKQPQQQQQQSAEMLQHQYQKSVCTGVNNVAFAGGNVGNNANAQPRRTNKFLSKWCPSKTRFVEQPPTKTDAIAIATTESDIQLTEAPSAQLETCSNQFHDSTNIENHLNSTDDKAACNTAVKVPAITSTITSTMLATTTSSSSSSCRSDNTVPTNNVAQVNGMSKHFALSTDDLSQQQHQQHQQHQQQLHAHAHEQQHQEHSSSTLHAPLMAIKRGTASAPVLKGKSTPSPSISSTLTPAAAASSLLLLLGTRRPCGSMSSSIECIRKRSQLSDDDNDDDNDSSASNKAITLAATMPHSSTFPSSRDASTSNSTSSSNSSSGVFTSMDFSCSSATIKDELLRLSPSFIGIAAPPTIPMQQIMAPKSSHLEQTSSTSTVECSTACLPTPVDTTILSDATLATLSASTSPLSAPLSATTSIVVQLQPAHGASYRCPCDCHASFNASTELQRHVKVEHRLPILSWGGAYAELALPLRPPVDNAVLILELHNGSAADACQAGEAAETATIDERVKSADLAEQTGKSTKGSQNTKECWLRIKKLGEDCTQAAALLLTTADESADFVMETRLSGNKTGEQGAALGRMNVLLIPSQNAGEHSRSGSWEAEREESGQLCALWRRQNGGKLMNGITTATKTTAEAPGRK